MGDVTIDGVVFRPRRRTIAALLASSEAGEALAAAEDEVAGLEMRIDHTSRRLNALGDQDGDFDEELLARLHQERAALRGRHQAANSNRFRAQMQVLHTQCEDLPVDVDWLMEHLVWPDDAVRILGANDPGDADQEDGTVDVPPTHPGGETS